MFKFADLFVPEAYRDAVFALCAAMCSKAEIGLKATGNGHDCHHQLAFAAEGEVLMTKWKTWRPWARCWTRTWWWCRAVADAGAAPQATAWTCWTAAMRGAMCWSFWHLPELMVFNDEAQPIHEFKRGRNHRGGEWQRA